jgi:xylulose-5-phosphate/fructose-6-phosphate phosphoketolase
MTVLNDLDRFHLVMDTVDRLPSTGDQGRALKLLVSEKLVEHRRYIGENGQDMPEIRGWRWNA